jgi:hypothetical protein
MLMSPSRVRKHVMRVANKMHNVFEKLNGIHRDPVVSRLSLDICLSWRSLCLFTANKLLHTFAKGSEKVTV